MKRVLITGASGLLGRPVLKEFTNASWEVLGLAFSRATGSLKKVDITDEEQVRNVMKEFKPSVVVHSAAERRPDIVEKQEEVTKKLNVDTTAMIARLCGEFGAFMLYISTDYVFDGKNAPYQVDAQPNPLNKYGRSKLDGEKATSDNLTESAILRIPILYGEVEKLSESAVTILFQAVQDTNKPATMCDYQKRYPTHVNDIAVIIRKLAEKRLQDPSIKGIFHYSSNELMTKYSMAMTMAEIFNIPSQHIVADKEPSKGTPRPYDVHLDSTRLQSIGITTEQTPFKEGIQKCLKSFLNK
ncbi:methionine adenosyltransferase 2 subunit beta-like [Saccoglossus kowalevskii]|uniref:Methionine adenosyltransferase 2 subunit beta n=1 Tax=Saccoglossus kowalevskii TaxID=10224 RepID=A0ABM0H0C1_SACKO|nr:PREDICTED: methionine adenosyltransferase 2 subunit beta-like [Saccoglossus kowalevskii]